MPFLPLELLASGARELGLELSGAQLEQFDRFASLLVEANRRLNLTRITEPAEIVTGHYLDSLTCLCAFDPPPGATGIDVGTGAGFPGIPIAIARPDLSLTLLDAARKRLDFVAKAVELIRLDNVELVQARAEDAGRDPAHRERCDVAWARAFSEMKVLVELGLPLVRVGGRLVAQKGREIDEELAAARPMIGQLGGRVDRVFKIGIPHTEIVRQLVVVAKAGPTPDAFPRAYARIVRSRRRTCAR